jgi:chromosome segregation ATPase
MRSGSLPLTGPWPYPPMAGGADVHVHEAADAAEDTAEDVAEDVQEAIEDAADAARHAPEGAADIPHELHAELANFHVLHEQHAARIAEHEGAIGELRMRQEALEASYNDVARSAERAVEAAVDVPQEAAGEVLELPEEVIQPRSVHWVRRIPRWM